MKSKSLTLGVILGLSIFIPLSGMADTHEAAKEKHMIHNKNGSQASVKGPKEWFVGDVRIDPILLQAQEPSSITSALVTFEPGARTNWHTHPKGQLLIVTAGQGWTQCEDGEKVVVNAGDSIWCPPNHKHWHGATSSTGMSHIAVQEVFEGTNVEWLEPVTDEQYAQ